MCVKRLYIYASMQLHIVMHQFIMSTIKTCNMSFLQIRYGFNSLKVCAWWYLHAIVNNFGIMCIIRLAALLI